MSLIRTYAELNLYELKDLFDELDLPNAGGSLTLRHVPLHPALASPAVPAAVPAVPAPAAVEPEQERPSFPRTELSSIREVDAAAESDDGSDVDIGDDGDASHGLLDAFFVVSTGTTDARSVSSDVDSNDSATTTTAAATTEAPDAAVVTATSPLTEPAAPLMQSPTANNGTADGRADVAADVSLEIRLAQLKAEYMPAVNCGLTTAELRELDALPGGIRTAWERTVPFGNGGLLWHFPGKEQEYQTDVTKRRAELKRAHKHLRETTLSAAEVHWEALVVRVQAQLSGDGFTASLAAVLDTLQFVQCAAITALRLDGYEIDEIKANRARTYGHYLDIPKAPAPPSTSGKRELRLAGYDDAAKLFNMVQ
jgi:hypothetical protein